MNPTDIWCDLRRRQGVNERECEELRSTSPAVKLLQLVDEPERAFPFPTPGAAPGPGVPEPERCRDSLR